MADDSCDVQTKIHGEEAKIQVKFYNIIQHNSVAFISKYNATHLVLP